MKKQLLTTIAGAALIAGCGLARAQTMESSPRGANGAQGSSQREPGGTAREHQPSAMQRPAEARSGAMQSPTQGRSAVKDKEQRSSQTGAMQSPTQGRSVGKDQEQRSNKAGATQGSDQGRASVGSTTLSSDQRTKLQQTVASGNIHRVNHVDFALAAGTRVPNNVTFYDVPARIADIVPQYRGFKYIAVRDDFAIIDPDTRDIVAVVPMHGSAVTRSGRSLGSTKLSRDQRTRLHNVITGEDVRRIDNADFALTVGTRVPNTVTFYDIPETIVDIVPEYRGDEYIVVGDQLVIIDPDTLEILAVLPA